jgi:hypothetical protein
VKKKHYKIGEKRSNKKIPAVTIVAACKRAETGVGPSIASGNQVIKKNYADFVTTARTNKKDKTLKSENICRIIIVASKSYVR